MTREPDRFDKHARELVHRVDGMTYGHSDDERAAVVSAALRAAESSALERAAKAVDLCCNRCGERIRALIPPAAAPAAECQFCKPVSSYFCPGHPAPAVEKWKAKRDEMLDELAAVLRGKDEMGEKLAKALGVPAGPLGRLVDAAGKRIAELERDHRLYAEWATTEFGRRAWQPNESYDEWQARIAARAAPPEGEGK